MYFVLGRRLAAIGAAALLAVLLFPADSKAQLLDFPPPTHPSLMPVGSWTYGYPFIELTLPTFGDPHPDWIQGRTTYDGTYLTVEAFPQWMTFATAPYWYQAIAVSASSFDPDAISPCGVPDEGGDPSPPVQCGRVEIKMMVDSYTGALVGGTDTDLVFRGRVVLEHFECDDGRPFVLPQFPGDPAVCSDGPEPGPYHSVVDFDANGTLLTGKVVEIGSEFVDATTARFNFNVRITGGLLTESSLGANKFDKNAFQLGVDITSSNFSGSFAAGAFSGQAKGVAGALPLTLGLFCTSLVNGKVWNDMNRNGLIDPLEAGVAGAAVTLRHGVDPPKSATTDANGRYAFPYVCGGDNQVEVTPTTGYEVVGASSVIVSVPTGAIVSDLNFGIAQVPVGSFTTYRQAAWGAKPRVSKLGEPNAAQILADNFDAVYPGEEVVIGIPDTVNRYSITLTGAAVIQTFLPQGQKNVVLTKSYVDPLSLWKPKHQGKYPHHVMISGFAGDVMALQLNVDFSSAGVTRWGLGELRVVSGPLAGKTVREILTLANRVLGGDPLPAGLTLNDLDTVLEKINDNFESGAKDKGYLN